MPSEKWNWFSFYIRFFILSVSLCPVLEDTTPLMDELTGEEDAGSLIFVFPKEPRTVLFTKLTLKKILSKCLQGFCCCCLVTKSCPTLCSPIDCSLQGSSVHGIFQARILEWVAISFSRRSSQPRDWTHIFCIGKWILYNWATREFPLQGSTNQLKNIMLISLATIIS